MDDLVLRVKQIGNYPFAAKAAPTDALLIQQGGLGGSYAYINPAGITAPLSARIDTLQIQLSGFNATVADLSTSWTDQFNTMIAHITDTTVWSFNGRRGDVGLTLWDIVEAGGASSQNAHLTGYPTTSNIQFATQTDSQIANTEFVQRAIAWRTKELLTTHPFVFAWNGRIGRVCMSFDDVEAVLRDGNPTVPDQLESDFSGRVANTRFVQRLIEDVRIDLSNLEQIVYAEIDASSLATKQWVEDTFAPINSPSFSGYATAPTQPVGTNTAQIATCAYVMASLAESIAGVATWNGRSGNVVFDSGDLTGVGGALINSPAFTGSPTAPTQPTGTSNTTLATTAFVLNEISAIDAGVVTFNNRSGPVTLLLTDVTGVGGAPIASPNFSGAPTAVTASPGTSTTQLATTAFVMAAVAAAAGVASFEGRTGAVTLTANDISARGGALLASPTFTGTPAAPTAIAGTSTTQLATTAFVQAALAANVVSSFNGRTGAVTLSSADLTAAGGALLASPTFTGTPAAPTATAGTNTTQIASTAFVGAAAALKGFLAIQVFIANGTYTPTPGMTACLIECVGGGGGGSGTNAAGGNAYGGAGGGGGAYARKWATAAQVGASQVVGIGAGGAQSVGANQATGGGTSSVGTLCTATGGAGANANNYGGPGGGAGTGDFVIFGSPGGGGYGFTGYTNGATSGAGGGSAFGGGAQGVGWVNNTPTNGIAAVAWGGGGSGSTTVGTAGTAQGGPGRQGVVVITEFR